MRPRLSDAWLHEVGIDRSELAPRVPTRGLEAALLLFVTNSPLFFLGPAAVSAITGGLISAVGYGLAAAASIGVSLALQKTPSAPKPSDVQTNIRQPISARRRIYGRYLTGSVIVFGFRRGEKSYILHYIGEGPIEGYVSFRLDKKPVTLDEDGFVTQDQYRSGGRSRVQILTTLGLMTDEPFQSILDAFPELDDPLKPFRHRGCAMVLQIVEQVKAENMQDVYPNNMPGLTVVIDGLSNIYDPRTDEDGFTDNAGLCLLAETMDVYGLTTADVDKIDLASFGAFADRCHEDVPLKAGGTEKRWRCAGPIMMNAENEERIKTALSVCNGDVYVDPQGRIAVREKMRSSPSIALRHKNGDHLDLDLSGGRGLQKGFNTVKVTYLETGLNYKENEVVWRHPELLEEDGQEYVDPLTATLCPSGTQAQRLGKLYLHEQNPEFAGSLSSGPQALDLFEDYAFTLDLTPEDSINRAANATTIEFDSDKATASVSLFILRVGATDWNPLVDEQDQVVIPPNLPSNVNDITLIVTPVVELSENSAPVLKFSWVPAGAAVLPDSYSQQIQVSPADAEDWHDASVNQDLDNAQYGTIVDGGAYDWQIRNISSGKTFDWQKSVSPVTVIVDTTAPQALDAFSVGDGVGQFIANLGTKNDSHLATVAIYKVPSGETLDRAAHLVSQPFSVAPGISYALPITSAVGTFDIYAEPFNRSSIAGPLAGPDAAIVT